MTYGNETELDRPLGPAASLSAYAGMAWRAGPALTAASLALRVLRAAVTPAALYVGKLLTDVIVAAANHPFPTGETVWRAWRDGNATWPALLVGTELALMVVSDAAGRTIAALDLLLAERLADAATARLIRHAAALDLRTLEAPRTRAMLDRARMQASGRTGLTSLMASQAQDALTLAALATTLAAYVPWLSLALAASLVPTLAAEMRSDSRQRAMSRRHTVRRRELELLRQAATGTSRAKEIKLLDLGPFLAERFETTAARLRGETRGLAWHRATWGGAAAAVGMAVWQAAYAWLAWQALRGAIGVGDLAFLAGSLLRLRATAGSMAGGWAAMTSQAGYLGDMFLFLRLRPSVRSRPGARPVPSRIRTGFRFEAVGLRYPGSDRWALRGFDLHVPAGRTLALAGENGAGKSSVVKLLTRLYDPDEGRVTLDGIDLRDYDLDSLRRTVSVVLQDFAHWDMTAADNVAVGEVERRHDRQAIVRAAVSGQADPAIRKLPMGYDQPLGSEGGHAVELSGGEWQRVAIARAAMRESPVIVLDEPTAALDARAESEAFRRFHEQARGRTVVIVSHRMASLRLADWIAVLAEGRVEAEGMHDDLIAAGGRYAELFELQAAAYR